MYPPGPGGTIPDALNRKENHDRIETSEYDRSASTQDTNFPKQVKLEAPVERITESLVSKTDFLSNGLRHPLEYLWMICVYFRSTTRKN